MWHYRAGGRASGKTKGRAATPAEVQAFNDFMDKVHEQPIPDVDFINMINEHSCASCELYAADKCEWMIGIGRMGLLSVRLKHTCKDYKRFEPNIKRD